jgi:hypothetical protein
MDRPHSWEKRFFSIPDQPRGPQGLVSHWYWEYLLQRQGDQHVKLIIYLPLMPRSEMSVIILPLPNTFMACTATIFTHTHIYIILVHNRTVSL